MAFDDIRKAHEAMLSGMPNYREALATSDPEGAFEIAFRDRLPPPPEEGLIELESFSVTGDFGKNWKAAGTVFPQFLRFMAAPERNGAELCGMSMDPRFKDPITGEGVRVSVDLPKSESEGSKVAIVFFDNYQFGGDLGQRKRCVEAMLGPVFPELVVIETGEGFAVTTAPGQTSVFAQKYQTFRGEVTLPWPQEELVERLPALLPAEWKPRPELSLVIMFTVAGGMPAEKYREGWLYISEHLHPVPKGWIHIDFALRRIEGLEMIRGGAKRKKGVPVALGQVTWGNRQWANLVARVFNDAYGLELHGRGDVQEIVDAVERITGAKFEPIEGARVV